MSGVIGEGAGVVRSKRVRGDDGALLVEAAFIFPLLILLAFGIIEWSMVYKDQVEVTSVARAGARTASSLAPLQNPYEAKVTAPGGFTKATALAVASAASGLPYDAINYIRVYRANSSGHPGPDSNTTSFACVNDSTCDQFNWVPTPAPGAFVQTGSSPWNATAINSCTGDAGAQSVGVYVEARHRMLTGIFGSERILKSYTVMKFEPQRPGRCKP